MQRKTISTTPAFLAGIVLILAISAGCSDNGGAGDEPDTTVDADQEPVDEDQEPVDADQGPEDASVYDAPDDWVNNVDWEECPLYPDGSSARMAECALIEFPLRAAEPEGPTIEIWVQRLRGTSPHKQAQIWLLEGGPGG